MALHCTTYLLASQDSAVVCFRVAVINVAGVKWVIRLQLVLLMVLFVAVLDFLVGSFVHTEPGRYDTQHGSVIIVKPLI